MSSLQKQLERVYADPESDVERQRYADMLTSGGNPRGEFISLQLLANPTVDELNRADDLLN